MKVNALVPYYGAKRLQAPGIVKELGDHAAYWELFGGSAAVLFAKEPSRQEVFNDLHGGVVNLVRVVQDDELSVRLFDRLSRTAFCEHLHRTSVAWLEGFMGEWETFGPPNTATVNFNWAYHYFVASWMGRNGLAGTEKELATGFCKRFTSNGGDPAVRFRNAVESVPSWWLRLRGVTVLSEDAIGLAERIEDKVGTVVYADPPYLVKGAKYRHDFTEADHERLAVALRRFEKTRVVVSYYAHPKLQELYLDHGFRLVEKTTKKQMGNGEATAPEVLLIRNTYGESK
jgi:DNA adenine methylase